MFLNHFGDIFGLGTPELILITVLVLVIFGGSQLPKLAKNLSSSAKELRTGFNEGKKDNTDTKVQ